MIRLHWLSFLLVAGCIAAPPQGASGTGPVTPDEGPGEADVADEEVDEDIGLTDSGSDVTSDVGDVANADDTTVTGDTADANDATPSTYRVPITVAADTVASQLDNFPLLLDMTVPELPTGQPEEISFVDAEGNALSHDIELHDTDTGVLRAWILLPVLTPAVATTFYLDFERRANDPAAVWSEYAAVWHLDALGASGEHHDHSGSGHSAAPVGSPPVVPGKIGNAVMFDGLGQRLEVLRTSSLEPQTFTISMWARLPSLVGENTLITKPIGDAGQESYQIWVLPGGAGFELFYGETWHQRYYTPFPEGTWVHVGYSFDGTTMAWYIDGEASTFEPAGPGPVQYDTSDLLIGADADVGVPDEFLYGQLDEIRIAPVAFSAQRLDAERRNQDEPSSFYTVGGPEPY